MPGSGSAARASERRRRQSWLSFARRKELLTFDDTPAEQRPTASPAGSTPTPFALNLWRVDGWKVPAKLHERVMAAGHSLELSLSLSFFHRKSRRFFGSTWLGPRRLPDDGEGGGADFDVAYKSMLYWYSHVDDQECLAIVELVATQLDTSMKGDPVTVAQYGCGWTCVPTPQNPHSPARTRPTHHRTSPGTCARSAPRRLCPTRPTVRTRWPTASAGRPWTRASS